MTGGGIAEGLNYAISGHTEGDAGLSLGKRGVVGRSRMAEGLTGDRTVAESGCVNVGERTPFRTWRAHSRFSTGQPEHTGRDRRALAIAPKSPAMPMRLPGGRGG
jgi:hypothetical protein